MMSKLNTTEAVARTFKGWVSREESLQALEATWVVYRNSRAICVYLFKGQIDLFKRQERFLHLRARCHRRLLLSSPSEAGWDAVSFKGDI